MKKMKKSSALSLALLIYISATAAYFLPRNSEISVAEKYVTVFASYVIVLLLWLVLRHKEHRKERNGNFFFYQSSKVSLFWFIFALKTLFKLK